VSFGRTLTRGLPRRGRMALPRPAAGSRRLRRWLLVAVVVLGLLFGGWLWLRDSSLVGVTHVRVTGVSGPDAPAIRGALVSAARGMTTLDVNTSQLRTAVASFPVVAGLSVSTDFPHGMRIQVIERFPVALVSVAGKNVPVASDGTLLHDTTASTALPVVPLTVPPGGPRLVGQSLDAIRLLAAAPAPLLAKVSQVTTQPSHGLVAQLRDGPSLYFGDASSARAKWSAAAAVLADPGSAGAAYIDVTNPVRPAAGAGSQESGTSGSASTTPGG
jgi:cell division protein FtsQ